ncbi:hypothetical protein GF380_06310 [Candidatus Uhrbacteria bacterium]|nr:hypothetical protein [Candidatus Uhrbacteria bacterium]MBD3284571.1 hypothetical protein [Candidatus Uhrbacteria bacterium]
MSANIQVNQTLVGQIRSLGLNKHEAAIYVALLELGGGFPSKIAEVAKRNRTTTYATLTDLAVKGLVIELQRRNKIYYQIEKPDKLLRYVKQRVRIATDAVEKAERVLPEIEGLFNLSPQKPRIRYFEGFPEVLQVHEDHMTPTKKYEMLAWTNGKEIGKWLPAALVKQYLARKIKLGVTTRVILPDTPKDRTFNETYYKRMPKNLWPVRRYAVQVPFESSCEITIYGTNKVSVLNFSQDHPVGIIIEDQVIHDMLTMMFELSWKGSKS